MMTSEIQCCISCDVVLNSNIVGVFAADQLPEHVANYPYGFIANTEKRQETGQHWCAFYIPRGGRGEFFDSYAQKPDVYNAYFDEWLKKHVLSVKRNQTRIQSNYSNVCGLYCLFYLRQRLNGHSMEDIVKVFSDVNVNANDQFIYDYMTMQYANCTRNKCVYNQTCKPFVKRL